MSNTTDRPAAPDTTAAATDVPEFFSDLDGGQLERKLSVALSKVAAAVVDHDKAGGVSIKLRFTRIEGTHQVACAHEISFDRPTADGSASEVEKRTTVLHVGRFGRLSLAQPDLLDGKRQSSLPT